MSSVRQWIFGLVLAGFSINVFCLPSIRLTSPFAFPHSDDPEDFSNLRSIAAIGDSYSSGIGVDTILSSGDDKGCSRYSGSHPVLIDEYIKYMQDDQDRALTFLSCAGAKVADISEQAKKLPHDSQDLIMVSAGGNDIGFMNVLKRCIYLANSETSCDDALKEARDAINDNKLLNKIADLAKDIDRAVRNDGIVIFTEYGRFFNAATDFCNDKTWSFFDPFRTGPSLTKELRQRMNDLVGAANQAIEGAIKDAVPAGKKGKYVLAKYDNMFGMMNGRFCEDGETSNATDVGNSRELFQRTGIEPTQAVKILKRSASPVVPDQDEDIRVSAGDYREYPSAEDLDMIKRDDAKSDGNSDNTERAFTDPIYRVFHPNSLGQSVIAQSVLAAYVDQRAKDLNFDGGIPDSCKIDDNPKDHPPKDDHPQGEPEIVCERDDYSKYAAASVVYDNAKELCKGAPFTAGSEDGAGSHFVGTYQEGTDDEVDMVGFVPAGKILSEDDCNKWFKSLIDGCNYNVDNPMNWKHGGTIDVDSYHFDVSPKHERRMPHWQGGADGWCKSVYQSSGNRASFEVWGGGWGSSGTTGKDNLHHEIRGCGAVSYDSIEWFKQPMLEDGENGKIPNEHWEWRYHGFLPIGTRRCVGRAMHTAGGPNKRCGGSG